MLKNLCSKLHYQKGFNLIILLFEIFFESSFSGSIPAASSFVYLDRQTCALIQKKYLYKATEYVCKQPKRVQKTRGGLGLGGAARSKYRTHPLAAPYRGTSLTRNSPPPLRPPYDPGHSPTVGSQEGRCFLWARNPCTPTAIHSEPKDFS